MRLLNRFLPLLTILSGLLIWEFCTWYFAIRPFILPSPTRIIETAINIAPNLVRNMGTTLWVLLTGYTIGVLAGIFLAVVMLILPAVRRAIFPIIVMSQTIPKIAIAPLLILWFGVGPEPKVFIIALLAFFPVLINTVSGLEGTERGHLELMRSVDANLWNVYRHVRLPAAVPQIFAGLKLALTVSVIGAVVGEWVVGNQGLGYLLLAYNSSLETASVFATLLLIITITAVLFYTITRLEKLFSWRARLNES